MSPNPGLCMLGYMFNLVPVVERRVPGSAPPSCRLLKLCVDGDMSRVCLVSPSVIQHDGGRPCLDYEWPGRAGWVDFRRDGRLSGLFIFSLPFLWSLPPNTPPRSLHLTVCGYVWVLRSGGVNFWGYIVVQLVSDIFFKEDREGEVISDPELGCWPRSSSWMRMKSWEGFRRVSLAEKPLKIVLSGCFWHALVLILPVSLC